MKKLFVAVLFLTLTSIACLQSAITPQSAQTHTATPSRAVASARETDTEPHSGAVYQVPTYAPKPKCLSVTAMRSLTVRAEPDRNAQPVTWLLNGEQVEYIGTINDWYWIKSGDTVGYAHSAYMEKTSCDIPTIGE